MLTLGASAMYYAVLAVLAVALIVVLVVIRKKQNQ